MPRAKKSPAYQWYPRDYMADPIVITMTLEQEGAYRRLMDVCWLERGLPTNVDELWRIAKAPSRDAFIRRIWNVVGRKFQLKKGKFQHRRLDRERAKQSKTSKERQIAAFKMHEKRRSKSSAIASRLQCFTSSSATASSSTDQQPRVRADWFEECKTLHNGECGLSSGVHRLRIQTDAEKSKAAS